MMIRKTIIIACILLLPLASAAQDDDFGIWFSAKAKIGLTSHLDANLSGELRTFENSGTIDQGFLEAGADYSLTGYLTAGLSYRFIQSIEDDLQYHPQHKLFLDVRSSVKAGDFSFQGRIRYQVRFRTYFEDVNDKIPGQTIRVRLKIIYRTPSFPLNPYIYAEPFLPLFNDAGRLIGKNRFGGGVEYVISKRHSMEAGYLFQRDYIPGLRDEHIVQVGYIFDF